MADERDVRRIGDMHPTKFLGIYVQKDGDVRVAIMGPDGCARVEFCALSSGGGRSPHTRKALLALMEAMKKDNIERPID